MSMFVQKHSYESAIFTASRRDAGVVERGGLENRCAPSGHRGFESLSLRKTINNPHALAVDYLFSIQKKMLFFEYNS